jgi:hypothetical protein
LAYEHKGDFGNLHKHAHFTNPWVFG